MDKEGKIDEIEKMNNPNIINDIYNVFGISTENGDKIHIMVLPSLEMVRKHCLPAPSIKYYWVEKWRLFEGEEYYKQINVYFFYWENGEMKEIG